MILVGCGFEDHGKQTSYGYFAFENCSSPYFMGAGISDGGSAEELELLAMKEAMIRAKNLEVRKIFVCSDFKNAITATILEFQGLEWTLTHLIEVIRNLVEDFKFRFFKQVPRKAVAAAHRLAEVGIVLSVRLKVYFGSYEESVTGLQESSELSGLFCF